MCAISFIDWLHYLEVAHLELPEWVPISSIYVHLHIASSSLPSLLIWKTILYIYSHLCCLSCFPSQNCIHDNLILEHGDKINDITSTPLTFYRCFAWYWMEVVRQSHLILPLSCLSFEYPKYAYYYLHRRKYPLLVYSFSRKGATIWERLRRAQLLCLPTLRNRCITKKTVIIPVIISLATNMIVQWRRKCFF